MATRGTNGLYCSAEAARARNLSVLQAARADGLPVERINLGRGCQGRASTVVILQWARENNCPWGASTCAGAARKGHLHILQWPRQNDCPWDHINCSAAATGWQLGILQWARENGCPWNLRICSGGARGGAPIGFDMGARENGCHWNAGTCEGAARGAHLRVLQWARARAVREMNRPVPAPPARAGIVGVLRCAREIGCLWDRFT